MPLQRLHSNNGALLIKALENKGIYTLIKCFFNGQAINFFNFFFEIYVPLYPTVDRPGCIYSVKFEFCFSIFFKNDYVQLEISVIPKVHAVFYNIKESWYLNGRRLGPWREETGELLYQEFSKCWEKYLVKDQKNPMYNRDFCRQCKCLPN